MYERVHEELFCLSIGEGPRLKMSKGHVHLYGLAALLCVCMVMSENGTHTTALVHTTQSPNLTTAVSLQSTSSGPEDNSTENSTEYSTKNSTANPSNVTTAEQDRDSVSPTTDDSGTSSTDDYRTSAASGYHTSVAIFISTSTTGANITKGSHPDQSTVGVVFLVLILIIIVALAVLLYFLWKKGRTYSFDLSQAGNDHETPLRSMEHGGTFEHTNKELPPLDFVQEDKPQTNPTANGCAAEADKEASPSGQQNVPEEDSFMSDTSLTPPPKKVEFSLDLDLIGDDFEMVELPNTEPSNQQQNENNNITNSGNDSLNIFTEINLGEPQ